MADRYQDALFSVGKSLYSSLRAEQDIIEPLRCQHLSQSQRGRDRTPTAYRPTQADGGKSETCPLSRSERQ